MGGLGGEAPQKKISICCRNLYKISTKAKLYLSIGFHALAVAKGRTSSRLHEILLGLSLEFPTHWRWQREGLHRAFTRSPSAPAATSTSPTTFTSPPLSALARLLREWRHFYIWGKPQKRPNTLKPCSQSRAHTSQNALRHVLPQCRGPSFWSDTPTLIAFLPFAGKARDRITACQGILRKRRKYLRKSWTGY